MSYESVSGINAYTKQLPTEAHNKKQTEGNVTTVSPVKTLDHVSEDTGKTKITNVKEAVETTNKIIDFLSKGARFNYVESLNQFQVQIVNKNTGEVLKEFPSEQMIKIAEDLQASVSSLIDKQG